jgi:hypothetical protein
MNKKTITAGRLLDERLNCRYVQLFCYVGTYNVKSIDYDTMNNRYVVRSDGSVQSDFASTEIHEAAIACSELPTD